MHIEAVILTGGASRRMGQDKAEFRIEGIPSAQRIANSLASAGIPVTILGRNPIDGHRFLRDSEEYAGPLNALARFSPSAGLVFICACDLPLFDPRIVGLLASKIEEKEAAVPFVDGFRQPLCGLFAASAFASIPAACRQTGANLMMWLDSLDHVLVSEKEISQSGIDPLCVQGANTPEEFEKLLASRESSFKRR